MDKSKEDKEAEINAKIAAIRAKNAERERRHAEVEADRRRAEQTKSAVKLTPAAEEASSEGAGGGGGGIFHNPFGDVPRRTQPGGNVKSRLGPTAASPEQGKAASKAGSKRLTERDLPPPDPGYNFLADRLREESDDEEPRSDRHRPHRTPEPRSRLSSVNLDKDRGHRGPPRPHEPKGYERRSAPNHRPHLAGRAEDGGFGSRDHRRDDLRSVPARSRGSHPSAALKPLRDERSAAPKSSAQSRLERAKDPGARRSNFDEGTNSVADAPWICPDPNCEKKNPERSSRCSQCGLPWSRVHTFRRGPTSTNREGPNRGLNRGESKFGGKERDSTSHPRFKDDAPGDRKPWSAGSENRQSNWQEMPPVSNQEPATLPSPVVPHPTEWSATSQDGPVVIGNWQAVQNPEPVPAPPPEAVDHWSVAGHSWREGSAGSDWAEEVMNEIPDIPTQHNQGMQWIPSHPQVPTQPYAIPPSVHGADSYIHYDQSLHIIPNYQQTMMQPGNPEYIHAPGAVSIPPLHQVSPQQVQNVAVALTQMTHASHHNVPIMATHSSQQPVHNYNAPPPPRYQQQQPAYYPQSPPYGERTFNGSSNGDYQRRPHRESGRGVPLSSNTYKPREFKPEREITKIPSRFQKQKPSQVPNTYSQRKALSERNLPKAATKEAPHSARRMTVFGTSNIVNNLAESQLSKDLGIPVRLIPSMKLADFREQIEKVDPALDRFVLIHGLGNDARDIALKSTAKSDVDKGAESDEIASEFSEIVKNLIDRIPYVDVMISTLLPRFDAEEQMSMSCPNNVRKVMNVEISTRLNDVPNVTFINNDVVLEWWKDEVKKNRLLSSDGYHLTPYGFSTMLDNWMSTLKKIVKEADLPDPPEDEDSQESSPEDSVGCPDSVVQDEQIEIAKQEPVKNENEGSNNDSSLPTEEAKSSIDVKVAELAIAE